MSVLAVFRWEGDPEVLLAAYDRELQHAGPREQPRRVTHICARGDNEVVIVDLWETRRTLDVHVAVVKDQLGRRLATTSVATTPAGYAELAGLGHPVWPRGGLGHRRHRQLRCRTDHGTARLLRAGR